MFPGAVDVAGNMDKLLGLTLPQVGEQVELAGLFNGFFGIIDGNHPLFHIWKNSPFLLRFGFLFGFGGLGLFLDGIPYRIHI